MTQTHINVKPVNVDFSGMRKMVHTPKDGIVVPESDEYYIEQINNNKYLRDFLKKFERRLNKDIDSHMKEMNKNPLKEFLVLNSTIRQASVKLVGSPKKGQNADLLNTKETFRFGRKGTKKGKKD